MLINPESESYELFTKEEKDEFLYRIFGHLVLGGSLCQYEDDIGPYLVATKSLYKDLVSVRLENESENCETPTVVSHVIQILSAKADNSETTSGTTQDILFTHPHVNNFFYMVVDPFRRIVKTFYHQV